MQASQALKFKMLLAKKLKNEDVSADIAAMEKEELLAFKAWVKQQGEEAGLRIWREKRDKRAEAFARKFGNPLPTSPLPGGGAKVPSPYEGEG